MKDRTLAHIGYVVRDMKGALRRFQREGAEVVISPGHDPVQRVEVCLLRAGGVDIELVAPMDPEDCPLKGRLASGGGLDHICFYVDDLDEALAEEQGQGAMVVCEPCDAAVFGERVAFVHRRSGLVVELMTNRNTRGD